MSSARIAVAESCTKPVNPTRESRPSDETTRAQLVDRDLTARRLVHRAADDVAAYRQRTRQGGERLQKRLVSLPARERRDQPDAHDAVRSRQSRRGIEIEPWAGRRKAFEIDGVPHRMNRDRHCHRPAARRRRRFCELATTAAQRCA